jgi:hypothetical protein
MLSAFPTLILEIIMALLLYLYHPPIDTTGIALVSTKALPREDWLNVRRQGIGSPMMLPLLVSIPTNPSSNSGWKKLAVMACCPRLIRLMRRALLTGEHSRTHRGSALHPAFRQSCASYQCSPSASRSEAALDAGQYRPGSHRRTGRSDPRMQTAGINGSRLWKKVCRSTFSCRFSINWS